LPYTNPFIHIFKALQVLPERDRLDTESPTINEKSVKASNSKPFPLDIADMRRRSLPITLIPSTLNTTLKLSLSPSEIGLKRILRRLRGRLPV